MKKIIIVLFFLLVYFNSDAQLNFFIKSIVVSNVRMTKEKIEDVDMLEGPFIYITFVINNTSSVKQVLYPSCSFVNLCFNYQEKNYSIKVSIPFTDMNKVILMPGQSIEEVYGTNILSISGLIDKYKPDYSNEMIEILPTIKLKYKDEFINMTTNEIISVKVK